jgi:hypothetical protein
MDLSNLGVVRNVAFIVALVSEDSNFRNGNGDLLG